jgi:hypothetical protein
MRETEIEGEAAELVEGCVDLMQKYSVSPDTGKLNAAWLRAQLRLYEEDQSDFGTGVRSAVRQSYDELKEKVPRDVCAFLNRLVRTWCIGEWDEDARPPTHTEANMYLVLANHFWFDSGRFSHLSIIEKLDEVYGFMVDKGYEKIPGVTATMGSRKRRQMRDRFVRKYIREHPEVKEELDHGGAGDVKNGVRR